MWLFYSKTDLTVRALGFTYAIKEWSLSSISKLLKF